MAFGSSLDTFQDDSKAKNDVNREPRYESRHGMRNRCTSDLQHQAGACWCCGLMNCLAVSGCKYWLTVFLAIQEVALSCKTTGWADFREGTVVWGAGYCLKDKSGQINGLPCCFVSMVFGRSAGCLEPMHRASLTFTPYYTTLHFPSDLGNHTQEDT